MTSLADRITALLKREGVNFTMTFLEKDRAVKCIDAAYVFKLEKLVKELPEVMAMLKQHHDWHLEYGKVPQEFVGVDMSAEYCDSTMCDKTHDALTRLESVLKSLEEK